MSSSTKLPVSSSKASTTEATSSTPKKPPIPPTSDPSKVHTMKKRTPAGLNLHSQNEKPTRDLKSGEQNEPLPRARPASAVTSTSLSKEIGTPSWKPPPPRKYTPEELKTIRRFRTAEKFEVLPELLLPARLPPIQEPVATKDRPLIMGYPPVNPAPLVKEQKLTNEDLLNLKRRAIRNAAAKSAEAETPFATDQLSPRGAKILRQLQENVRETHEVEEHKLAGYRRGERWVPESPVLRVPGSSPSGARAIGPINGAYVWNDFGGFLWNVIIINVLHLLWFLRFGILVVIALVSSDVAGTNWLGLCDPWTPYYSPKFSFSNPSWAGAGTSVVLNVCASTGALRQATAKNLALFDQFTNISIELAEPVVSHANFSILNRNSRLAAASLRRKQGFRHTCLSSETIRQVADMFSGTQAILEAILEDSRDYFTMIGLEMNDLPPNPPNCKKGFKQGWKHEKWCQDRSSTLYGGVITNQLKHANRTFTHVLKGEQIFEGLGQHLVFIGYIRDVSSYRRDKNHKEYFQRLTGGVEDSAPDLCSLSDQIDAYQKVFSPFGKGVYVDFELAVIDLAQQLRVARSRLETLLEGSYEDINPQSSREQLSKRRDEVHMDAKFLAWSPAQIDAQIRDRKHILREIGVENDYQRGYVNEALIEIAR